MPETDKTEALPATFTPMVLGAAPTQRLCSMLEGTRLFGVLPRPDIEKLTVYVRAYGIDTGHVVTTEGQQLGFMCVIISGRLRVHKDSGRGKSTTLAELAPGTSIGEMSVIDGMPSSATAVAMEPTTLAVFKRSDLLRLIDDHPQLGAKLLWKLAQLLSQRLRQTSDKLVGILG